MQESHLESVSVASNLYSQPCEGVGVEEHGRVQECVNSLRGIGELLQFPQVVRLYLHSKDRDRGLEGCPVARSQPYHSG